MVCLPPAGFWFAFLLNLSILDMFVKHIGSVEFSKTHQISGDSVLLWFSVFILLCFRMGGQDMLCGSREMNRFWSAIKEEVVPKSVPF